MNKSDNDQDETVHIRIIEKLKVPKKAYRAYKKPNRENGGHALEQTVEISVDENFLLALTKKSDKKFSINLWFLPNKDDIKGKKIVIRYDYGCKAHHKDNCGIEIKPNTPHIHYIDESKALNGIIEQITKPLDDPTLSCGDIYKMNEFIMTRANIQADAKLNEEIAELFNKTTTIL